MPRAGLLAGRLQQRDRAHARGRLDAARAARAPAAVDPDAALTAWLDAHGPRGSLDRLARLDLAAYLRDTAAVAHPAAERLRQLAVWLEPTLVGDPAQPRAWLALDRIYAAAIAADPGDASAHRSRAVSAREAAELLDSRTPADPRARQHGRRMRSVAYAACDTACAAAPAAPEPWTTLGLVRYGDPAAGPTAALAAFDAALARDPLDAWALLYRAHCLHDLARWSEAAAAYAAVPAAALVGARAWRLEHLLEQRAWCWLQAGEPARATAEFAALLGRWERDLGLAREAWGEHVMAAAAGPLAAALTARVDALASRLDAEAAAGRERAWPGLRRVAPP